MSEQLWGTSPEGEDEARKRQAEREAAFERKLDKIFKPQTPRKGVSLEKDDLTRATYTGGIAYDSTTRREAIRLHLERMGVSQHLQQVRDILERGNAAPPGQAAERGPGAPGRSRGGGGPELGPRGQDRDRDR